MVRSFSLVLFLFLVLVAANAWADPSLLKIFCGELTLAANSGYPLAKNDKRWRTVVQALETRTVREEIKSLSWLQDSVDFQKCLQTYSSDFSLADFALAGRQLLGEGTFAETTAPSHEPLRTSSEMVVEGISVTIQATEGEPGYRGKSTNGRKQRITHYDSLWKEFTASLRRKLELRVPLASKSF